MNQPSLRKFEKEIREFRHKKRSSSTNGMGVERLAAHRTGTAAILVRANTKSGCRVELRRAVVRSPHFGPKIVMQNWRSASNAEMFPAGSARWAWAR